MSQFVIDTVAKISAGLVLAGEFLFLGYPLIRKRLSSHWVFSQLLYSNVLSSALMIIILWGAYSASRSIEPLVATSDLLVFGGIVGTSFFCYDFARRRRRISGAGWGFILLIGFAAVLAILSAVSLPFSVQGDAYGYYVPIGRYLNQYPGDYVNSYYRFSLSRNFGYYAVYAHADILGGSVGSYLFLPVPFILGTIFGVISLSRALTHSRRVALLSATCFVLSICFILVLKYNMFYLGNLFMATMALYLSYFLVVGARNNLEKLILPLATFAMLLLYDFTFLLLIPLALGYIAYRKPKLVFYVAAGVALPLSFVLLLQSVSLGFVQVQQLDPLSFVAFVGLVLVVLAGLRGQRSGAAEHLRLTYPTILSYIAAAGSLISQRIVNLFTLGFMTVNDYTLSSPVITYMNRGYWGYQTPPNIPNTLFSIFFSDVFLGWGLLFTVYGLLLSRGRPVTTFFLTALPLAMLVETVNDNYFRFAIFLVPLIAVFLASGLYKLLQKYAFNLVFSLSFIVLLVRAVSVLPGIDYEHRAFANPADIALLGTTILLVVTPQLQGRYHRIRTLASSSTALVQRLILKSRSLLRKLPLLTLIGRRQILGTAILILCIPALFYNVLATPQFQSTNITDIDATFVNQQILPLIQAPSTVLTVELIHPNFNFYKDVVIIQMAQPWILESFLRLQVANVTALMTWLSVSKIRYIFVDRGLTQGNEDVFGLFDQLTVSCQHPSCTTLHNDGRFVLIEIAG